MRGRLSRRWWLGAGLLLLGAGAASAGPASREIFRDPEVAALAEAVLARNAARAVELVAAGANPNARGDRNVTLLQWVMLARSPSGFGILLDLGADPALPGIDGDGAIHFAAKANDTAYLRLILARHGTVDARNLMTGRTPLMEALVGNRMAHVQMLHAAGARLDLVDTMGNTPLHIAAQISNSAQVLAMLEQGAPARARNRQGKTFQTYFLHDTGARARRRSTRHQTSGDSLADTSRDRTGALTRPSARGISRA